MPSVSIIVNVCNGAATLREALQSALGQTCTDWEMIVWDDRSTDESAAIVSTIADPRIRYFLAPQQIPLGQARDAAIREARGEWLAFLDQDDIWLPNKLEQQLALDTSASVGLIYGRTVDFDPDGSERDHDYFHEFTRLPEGDISQELLGRGCFIAMSSALVRRSEVLAIGNIPDEIGITPDYFLYVAVGSRCEARAVQDVVSRCRVHPGRMTTTYRRESTEETLWLVGRFREQVPLNVYRDRCKHTATVLAVEELRHRGTIVKGIGRLVKHGSVAWLVGRPFVHVWRRLRRKLRRPYWKMSA